MSLLETLLAKIVHEKVEAGSKESIESSIDWKLIIAVGQTIRQWSFCFTSGTWALNKKLITEFYWTNYKINFAKGKSFFRTCAVVMSRWFLLNLFGWNKWCLTIWNIKVFVIAGHKNYDFLMKFWFVNFSIFFVCHISYEKSYKLLGIWPKFTNILISDHPWRIRKHLETQNPEHGHTKPNNSAQFSFNCNDWKWRNMWTLNICSSNAIESIRIKQ